LHVVLFRNVEKIINLSNLCYSEAIGSTCSAQLPDILHVYKFITITIIISFL